jgi:hypothetical protein
VGREVAITVMSPERWATGDDGFVTTLKANPMVRLELGSRS